MRVVIQNRKTFLYYLSSDKWVEEPSAAVDFEKTERALQFLQDNRQSDLQIVLNFEDNKYDMKLGPFFKLGSNT
jgi:hypothetical protein